VCREFTSSAEIQGLILGRVKSKTETLIPVASLVSVYHLRDRAGLVGPVSLQRKKYRYQAVKRKEQLKLKRQDYNMKTDTNDRTT